ncbi:hypothetical protein [Streptomyces sp. NPDC020681]|uniref:hypothetical protein n=1 Tax=Streptomyces sp. NPDC020681 TaxID=3365083 RepID=UPI0037AA92AE
MQKSTLKKWSARIAACTVVVASAVLVPVATAQAAIPGVFSVCNNGTNFTLQADLPPTGFRQGWSSHILNRGQCAMVILGTGYNQSVRLEIENSGGRFKNFGGFTFPTAKGVHVNVRGSFESPIRARS